MPDQLSSLDELRRRIDAFDDQIHDLLMRRAEVVEAVAEVKRAQATPLFRPGREAQILRRLIAHHRGGFPVPMLVRIWRELFAGTIAMQGEFHVAVFTPGTGAGYWDLARDHYGSHTPMLSFRSVGEVVSAVAEGRAAVGVLPMPGQVNGDAWWRFLMANDPTTPRVVARLPFSGRGNARGDGDDALAIARLEPEPSGNDRSLYIIETSDTQSRVGLLAGLTGAGLPAICLAAGEPDSGVCANLIEFDELVGSDDARLGRALGALGDRLLRAAPIGAYARQLSLES